MAKQFTYRKWNIKPGLQTDLLVGTMNFDIDDICLQVLDDFASKYPPMQWPTATESSITFSECDEFLQRYQVRKLLNQPLSCSVINSLAPGRCIKVF